MPFLTVNGYTTKVADKQARTGNVKPGRRDRSARGKIRQGDRYTRRTWTLETPVLPLDEAQALMHLVFGEGHFWDFADGLQASTSLVPLPGFSTTVRLNPQAWGAFGKGCLAFQGAGTIRWDVQARDDEWCVLWWEWDPLLFRWDGLAKRSDGMGYKNGVRDDTVGEPATAVIAPTVNGGILTLTSTGSGRNVDDMAFLPWKPTAAMLAAFTAATGKWGPCPLVRVTGDMVAGQTLFCVGEAQALPFQQGSIAGAWQNNLQRVGFRLKEMDPAYYLGTLTGGIVTPAAPTTDFGGPSLWFEAANADLDWNRTLADGNAISPWEDRGSRGQNLTNAVLAQRPVLRKFATRRLADAPALVFDGVDDLLSTNVGAAATSPVVIAAVFRMSALTVATVFDGVAAGNRHALRRNAGNQFEAFSSAAAVYPSATPTVGQYVYSVMQYTGGGASPWVMNGAAQAAVNEGSTGDLLGIRVGSAFGGGGFLNGQIVELLVWEDTVGTALLAQVKAYFEAKYGPLPQV